MKSIEEFIRVMEHDVYNHGKVIHSSDYIIRLDQDGLISHIEFANMPSKKYLASCHEKEKELILEWLAFKLKTMDEWKSLYNKSVRAYNDYCGKRAGESNELLDLVVEGYSIANVVAFKPVNKEMKEQSL